MADSWFNDHSASDSASNIDTMEEEHGLMPREEITNFPEEKIRR